MVIFLKESARLGKSEAQILVESIGVVNKNKT